MNKRPFIDWNDAILIAALREAEEDSTPDWYDYTGDIRARQH